MKKKVNCNKNVKKKREQIKEQMYWYFKEC